jgi:adenylate cyclase
MVRRSEANRILGGEVASDRPERRLTAILSADVAGYSRLMGADEEGTLAALKLLLASVVDPKVQEHRGHIVKTMGDGLLVEFASAVDAVRCAVDIQRAMAERNAGLADDRRLEFRIGVNVGDVIVDGRDVFGDGVNIAARVQTLAEPGGLSLTENAYRHVAGKIALDIDAMGEQRLKNIAQPIPVYKVRLDGPVATPKLALPDKPSIAVLPFENISGDPEQEYFADGMAEEIITALSRCAWLFVIARNSSFTYKGKNVDIRQVGRELGVRYVLEGSVRKGGDKIRFTAQLIEAASGAHIWADRFEGDLHDVFELQDRITGNVVAAIEPKLQLAEIARLKQKRAASLDAYDLYLRALQLENEFTEASLSEAIRCLERALQHDPNYAPAMALASYCHMVRSFQGWVKDFEAGATEALRLANRAIELEPDDGNILWMAAFAIWLFTGDATHAKELVERSLAVNPNAPMALTTAAWITCIDYPDQAIEFAERAQRLNPRDPRAWLVFIATGLGHLWAGRYREATLWAERALVLRRGATPFRILVISYIQLGERDKAVVALQELLKIDPTLTLSNLHLRARGLQTRERVWKLTYESLREAGLPE